MNQSRILAGRYGGDAALLAQLDADEVLGKQLRDVDTTRHQQTIRTRLLATAVRVGERLLPGVSSAFDRLREQAGIDGPMEAYVYDEPAINAFVTRGRSFTFVALSSGAINKLNAKELKFVIGHELGHALFEHVDVAAGYIAQNGTLDARQRMKLLAWQRAAEISADRAGVICCDSVDIAATAMFKTLSGLNIDGLSVDPNDFAQQWEHLENEVIEAGHDRHWELTHPFPPLRMKAMLLFWNSGFFQHSGDDAGSDPDSSRLSSDKEIDRLLATMDPLAREAKGAADPMLVEFFLWGGFYMAVANGHLEDSELSELESITSARRVALALERGVPTPALCLKEFRDAISKRSRRLSAMEIHRIVEGLAMIAMADGMMDEEETESFKRIVAELGLSPNAGDLLLTKFASGEAV